MALREISRSRVGEALFLALFLAAIATGRGQILADDRSGRVSPFRGAQTTYMFQWNIAPQDYLNKNWLDQPQALGSVFGLRPEALEHGLTLAGSYTFSVVGNVAGGQSRGAAYEDIFFMSALVDLGKLWGLDGWTFAISSRQVDGNFIGDIVGSTPIMAPTAEANREFRLSQLSLTWEGFDDTLQISVGRLILNNQFAHIPQAALFLNSAMSGYPGSLSTDITFTGINTARWGALLHYQPLECCYLLAGIFSADSSLGSNLNHGVDFSLQPGAGLVSVTELGLLTGRLPAAGSEKQASPPGSGPETWFGGNPGAYKIGCLISTAEFENFNTSQQSQGNWGVYATAAQMVYHEPGDATGQQGLTLFGTVTYFDPQVSQVPWFFSAGAFYQGLLPGRPSDQCGAAFSCALFSENLRQQSEAAGEPGQTNEMALEFTYSVAITPWAYLAPDLQVLINPGATGTPTAVTIGFQTGITF